MGCSTSVFIILLSCSPPFSNASLVSSCDLPGRGTLSRKCLLFVSLVFRLQSMVITFIKLLSRRQGNVLLTMISWASPGCDKCNTAVCIESRQWRSRVSSFFFQHHSGSTCYDKKRKRTRVALQLVYVHPEMEGDRLTFFSASTAGQFGNLCD